MKKDEDFRIFVRRKSFRPKIFFIRIFFCSGEDFFVKPNIIFVRTNKILLVACKLSLLIRIFLKFAKNIRVFCKIFVNIDDW